MLSKVKNSIQALREAPVEISQNTEEGRKGRNSERRAVMSGLSGEQSRESGEGYRIKASKPASRESWQIKERGFTCISQS